jgi:nucleotide-binding universal stress UspA family protein
MFRTVLIVRTVLIGVDGEPAGRDAIALAKRLVASDGKLMLAYVHFGDAWPTRGSSPAFEAAESDRSCELLEAARADASVEADLVWTGSPSVGRGLHELAERHRADLVVVGSCRRSLLGRAMIGDHTREALNAAPCAVAVAPRGYAERHAAVRVIGVGYSGSPESDYALIVARQLATELQAKVSAFEVVSLPLDRGTITELDRLWRTPGSRSRAWATSSLTARMANLRRSSRCTAPPSTC